MSSEYRIDYHQRPEIMAAMRALGDASRQGPLDVRLLELVKVRASQLNRCVHCLAMHVEDARSSGESDERLHLLAAWRTAPGFTEHERAALRWCEELTLLAERDVPEAAYAAARAKFSEDELCQLTLSIVSINSWNRIAVAFGSQPEQPAVGP